MERSARDALIQQLEPIARLSHGYFEQRPKIARYDGRIEGRIAVADSVVDGCDQAVPLPDGYHRPASNSGPLDPPLTITGAMFSIPNVELHGITFRLYDGRELYPDSDLLSFVFATFPGDSAPHSRMVEVLPDDQQARATRAAIRDARACLLRPSVHLRYYCERWVNLLLGTIKYFFVPDLLWRAYDDCPGYAELQAFYQQEDDGTLVDRAFTALAAGLQAEVESWTDDAAAVKSFWDRIKKPE